MATKASNIGKKAEAHYEKGDALREAGDLEAAIDAFGECLELDPFHISALNDRGIALHDLGEIDAAIESYQRVLDIDPDYLQTLNNIANALHDAGYWDEAMDHYGRALKIDPEYLDALYNMAVAYQEQGEVGRAVTHFREVLVLDPEHPTAGHMAAALSGETTAAPPAEYVRDLFDDYARSFEADLTGELGYRTPKVMDKLLRRHLDQDGESDLSFLDLGCGTGLLAVELQDLTGFSVGVDLSGGMLAEAEKKQLYDELIEDEIVGYMRRARRRFNLITAADVLVYLGDLSGFFEAAMGRLLPGGLLLISTEKSDEDGYELGLSGRYRHRRSYVQKQADRVGLKTIATKKTRLRDDGGDPVYGHCFLFQRPI